MFNKKDHIAILKAGKCFPVPEVDSVNHYIRVWKNTGPEYSGGRACFSMVGYDSPDAADKLTGFIDFPPRERLERAHPERGQWLAMVRYIKHIITDSPFKDVFLCKDVEWQIEHGFSCDVSQPSNLIIAALIFLRMSHEHSPLVGHWDVFRKNGATGDEALCLMKGIRTNEGRGWTAQSSGEAWHQAIHQAHMSPGYVRNFIQHIPDPKKLDEPMNVQLKQGRHAYLWEDPDYKHHAMSHLDRQVYCRGVPTKQVRDSFGDGRQAVATLSTPEHFKTVIQNFREYYYEDL